MVDPYTSGSEQVERVAAIKIKYDRKNRKIGYEGQI